MATTAPKTQYDDFAPSYNALVEVPSAKLETELVLAGLGDCTGLHVLDLAGGSGRHARRALESAGAASVDVVDISREMLRVGEEEERRAGRQGKVRWFGADLARPLREQLPLAPGGEGAALRAEGYDVVMANWLFDHAASEEELRAMWGNVVECLKPGGRFVGIRVVSVTAGYLTSGKYGIKYTEVEEFPGGLRYLVTFLTDPPFSFEATSMMSMSSLDHSIPGEMGLVDFQVVRTEEMETIQADPEFWAEYLEEPKMAVVTAKKPQVI